MMGHGGDVKGCDWHPTKAVVASGSKDGLVKVWDTKAGRNIATLHGHRNTVMTTLWNANGNWLLSACRDQSLKVNASFKSFTVPRVSMSMCHMTVPKGAVTWLPCMVTTTL